MSTSSTRPASRRRRLVRPSAYPVRLNKLLFACRRATHRWRLVQEMQSPISGHVSVWELGRERRLDIRDLRGAVTQSVIFTRGGWAQLEREFWGQALRPPVPLPARPRVLLLGLGGGTMVHLAHRMLDPQSITVVELDPVVAEMARTHMGLSQIRGLDIRIADVHAALAGLSDGPRFDLVIEDIFHEGLPDRSDESVGSFITSLENVLSADGALVFDRWFRKWSGEKVDADQDRLVRLLRQRFDVVVSRKIEQRFLNELIFAGARRGV